MLTHVLKGSFDYLHSLEFLRIAIAHLILGDHDDIVGVETYFGVAFKAKTVILTTGTFLRPVYAQGC